jgi:hypothetical protein
VLRLALDGGGEEAWVATPAPHVSKWRVAQELPTPLSPVARGGAGGRAFLAGTSPLARARQSFDGGELAAPTRTRADQHTRNVARFVSFGEIHSEETSTKKISLR